MKKEALAKAEGNPEGTVTEVISENQAEGNEE